MKNDSIQVSENISPKTLTKQLVEFQKSSEYQICVGFFLDFLASLGYELYIIRFNFFNWINDCLIFI